MPLKNFVLETASAPGTATTISLIGPAPGRMSFVGAGFTNGAVVEYYFMDDGTIFEYGVATFHTGSPNTLDRTTVIGNSAGTTARLSFSGTTDVYNEIPAERAVFVNASGTAVINGSLQVNGTFAQAQAISNKTAGYTIVAADRGTRFTSGTAITFTLPAAATAGAGWNVDITNNSPLSTPVAISVVRAGSDIIDATGDTTVWILPCETVTFTSTGVAWLTTGRTLRGRVVNNVNYASAGGSTASATAFSLLSAGLSYQPLSPTSIIDVTFDFQAVIGGAVGVATSGFFKIAEIGGAAATSNEYQIVANQANTEMRTALAIKYQIANSALTARVFQLQGRSSNTGASATGSGVTVLVTEYQNA